MSGRDEAERGNKKAIDIFLRVRPARAHSSAIELDQRAHAAVFTQAREDATGTGTAHERHSFQFTGVLPEDAQQEEVFEKVARPVVCSCLDGKHGTVFAYGQTGSGKTFTITGGSEKYADRGIIPRCISHIFSEISRRSDAQYSVHVSYMEVYNEQPYDLLDEGTHTQVQANADTASADVLHGLRKVHMREDDDGELHFPNLSVYRVNTEEEALNLLFLGDTNRAISETPMNMASSRSHCIFTVSLEAKAPGSEKVRRSKLNLVDLAGSERVSKTGLDGSVLKEAKYINLSLHYLQQVIVALQERASGFSRPHVPYRNSAMTSILRDSLGGNCRTAMVANITPEPAQLEESMSTCKFAQRVAMVSNTVQVNEETDPAAVIKRLKQENRELKEEIKLLRGSDADERHELTQGEHERIYKQVERYVNASADAAEDFLPQINMNMLEIKAAWKAFREVSRSQSIQQSHLLSGTSAHTPATRAPHAREQQQQSSAGLKADTDRSASDIEPNECSNSAQSSDDLSEQVKKLKLQVQQRDNEINILVSMLEKQQAAGPAPKVSSEERTNAANEGTNAKHEAEQIQCEAQKEEAKAQSDYVTEAGSAFIPGKDVLCNSDLLADRNKAFELFRKSYRKSEAIEENKQELKAKYDRAKELGQVVNSSRTSINNIKWQLQKRREQLSVASVSADGGAAPNAVDPEKDEHVVSLTQQLENEKKAYWQSFNNLRDIKAEIEHLHKLLDTSRQKLQSDFQEWLKVVLKQQREMNSSQHAEPQPQEVEQKRNQQQQINIRDATVGDPGCNFGADEQSQLLKRSFEHGKSKLTGDPPSTGDSQADADIRAFYEARQRLLAGTSE